MQVEISITIPPDPSVTKFKMDARKVLALLDILQNVVDEQNNSIQKRLDELEKEFFSESDPFSRLENVICSKHASDFKKILQKNALSERAVCAKYGVDRIEELTVSKALDAIVNVVLSKNKS